MLPKAPPSATLYIILRMGRFVNRFLQTFLNNFSFRGTRRLRCQNLQILGGKPVYSVAELTGGLHLSLVVRQLEKFLRFHGQQGALHLLPGAGATIRRLIGIQNIERHAFQGLGAIPLDSITVIGSSAATFFST